jgi:hypothetical protein
MPRAIVALLAVLALLTAFALYRASTENVTPAYVNLFVECPGAPDYGELIAPGAAAWFDVDRTRPASRIPHGTPVEIVTPDPDFPKVRYRNALVYVATGSLSDYDPAGGVRPDPSACAS